ncbi:uncharacterized protein (DUF305 family) [Antricoccus suffuscus]|uniref:Uncharacterized protein (DUF305 family) n=1 Tax=Antricoccus suffuscus TaxID=1629062 RepID=A0A2T1A448_9ACTN|nr:DUF305 domain-containing protein [Antricoccus suffuscus]PRZ43376.1 uncharacterized protein (DUF305 family) [Antricoccus suffuscus]
MPAVSDVAPQRPKWLLALTAAIVAISLLVAGGALAVIFHLGTNTAQQPPGEGSVDVGFARDMSAHHQQASEMASYVRDNSDDPTIRLLAFDIDTTQLTQIGQMQGMLLSWGRPLYGGVPMSWMPADAGHGSHSSDGLMPGMATKDEMAKLKSLTGTALDIYFLQLMLRHHIGGLPMAQYAADHAQTKAVRAVAKGMGKAQAKEVVLMEQMLRDRGAAPLPTK